MLKKMESWTKFAKRLSRPGRWEKYSRLLGGESQRKPNSPLAWAVPHSVLNGDTLPTIKRWYRSVGAQRKLRSTAREVMTATGTLTLGAGGQLRTDAESALLAIAAAQAMGAIAAKSDQGQWHQTLDHLLDMSVSPRSDWELSPWGYQLVSVELPMTLAFMLPEIETMEQTGQEAAIRMNNSLSAMLDLDGWPFADHLPVLAPLAASWTRCLKMARKAGFPSDPAVNEQVQLLVPQIFRLMRNDGSLMLSNHQDSPIEGEFENQLLSLMKGKRRDRKFAQVCRQKKPKTADVLAIDLPESSLSEWASSGVYQSQWRRRSPKLAIDYSNQQCRIEVGRDLPLLGGQTMPEIRLGGQLLEPVSDFEAVCDEQNDDLDFLELEIELSRGVQLQRQFILSRNDDFLIVADAVLATEVGGLDYRCKWPLAPGVSGMQETETRELYLTAGKIQSLVLPLALPEWRVARHNGQLDFDDDGLELRQNSSGRALYAPLVFDLSPKRSKRPRTWRPLTVAEQLKIVPSDVASAFRIQLDKQQWILYRSLAEQGNRTFMGENFNGELFLGSFDTNGQVKPLLQIE